MSFTKHKNNIVCKIDLVVQSIHNSKDPLKKVWKLQIKNRQFIHFLLNFITADKFTICLNSHFFMFVKLCGLYCINSMRFKT